MRLWCAWLAMGCGGETHEPAGDGTTPDAADTDDGAVPTPAIGAEVGTGYDAFVPLATGDEVQVYGGPQGGFHVFGSVRATALGSLPVLRFSVVHVASALTVADTTVQVPLRMEDEWTGTVTGLLGVLDTSSLGTGRPRTRRRKLP